MTEPRFYVREHIGMQIDLPVRPGNQNGEKASYYVMDRLYNCRVVETFENVAGDWGRSRAVWKKRAEARAAQLNEWWELELAS